jgi:hypothetical protein
MHPINVRILRRGDTIWAGFDAGSWQDRGADFPATDAGLADLRRAIADDSFAAPEDRAAIMALTMPPDGGRSVSIDLTGDGDDA